MPKGELSSYWGQPPPTLTPKQVGSYWNFKKLVTVEVEHLIVSVTFCTLAFGRILDIFQAWYSLSFCLLIKLFKKSKQEKWDGENY